MAFREIGMDMNLKWKKSSIFGLSKTSKIGTSFQVRFFTLYRMLTYIDLYAVQKKKKKKKERKKEATSEAYMYPIKLLSIKHNKAPRPVQHT